MAVAMHLLGIPDATAQWQKITTLPDETFYAMCQENNRMYAATANRVYWSDDGGAQWTPSADIHQQEDEVIDLLVINGIIYASTVVKGCYVSIDSGAHWQLHNDGLNGPGAQNHTALARRGDSLYVATVGAGVYVKPLLPVLASWSPYNIGMPWGNIFGLAASDAVLLAGAGANATLARHELPQTSWEEIPFDVFNGQINGFLGAMLDSAVWIGAGQQGLYFSTNDGLNWKYYNPGVGLINQAHFVPWNGQVLALLTKSNNSFLKITADHGETWSNFEPAFTGGGLGNDLLVQDGKLFCARTNGVWVLASSVGTGEPANAGFFMGRIFPNPSDGTTLTVPITVADAGDGRLRLCDSKGTVVRQLYLGVFTKGSFSAPIAVHGLPAGVYTVVLQIGKGTSVQRLILQQPE